MDLLAKEAASIQVSIFSTEDLTLDTSLLTEVNYYSQVMSSQEYLEMKLSEKLKILLESEKVTRKLTEQYLTQQNVLSKSQLQNLNSLNRLSQIYSELSTLTQKAIECSNDSVGAAIEEFKSVREENERLQAQMAILKKQTESLTEYYAKLEKRSKNTNTFINIAIPVMGAIPVTMGLIEMGNGNTDRGWNYVLTGIAITVSAEIVYQGGKWVLKVF
jgi:homoserine dehydrogenase